MTIVAAAGSGVLAASVASEMLIGRTKVQSALPRLAAVWAAAYAAAAIWTVKSTGSGSVALAIFWVGAFLVWFGVRSHIESSILLRMLFLLRRRPLNDAGLIEQYVAQYGEAARIAELRRGGFLSGPADRIRVTRKGRALLFVVSKLR